MKNALWILTVTFLSTAKVLANDILPKIDIQYSSKEVQYKNLPSDIFEYNYLDPKKIIPTEPLIQAVRFYKSYLANIKNQNLMTIIDMTQHSSKKRMYVIDMKTGLVSTYLAAHGKNSDSNNDGYADKFSNTDGSLMTSLGFYLTGETYSGSNGLSLRLMGLQKTNSNAMSRYIVMHGADYVTPSHVGRSYGCPAIEEKYVKTLIPALKSKSLLYIYKK
jgi:L,D-transpeptidase catalytic domain